MVEAVYSFSSCGKKREENQDAICYSSNTFALADGMGGKPNGASAAKLAATYAVEMCDKAILENTFCDEKLRQIFSCLHVKLISELPRSGSTLNIVAFSGTKVYCAHVGDSRTYILAKEKWSQIGRDQNLAAQTGLSVNTNILTNYLGKSEFESPHTNSFDIENFTAILLSSDGFYRSVAVKDITENDLDQVQLQKIEQHAHSQEPDDDYSAIILK